MMIRTRSYLETCSATEIIAYAQEHYNAFYRAPRIFQQRGPETYRACALAALRGLSAAAGHNFPRKGYGNDGWDAHHITKSIFEEQSVFDPYADKAFCEEAANHCMYYILRYTTPDALPKYSDFTPEQFADCFATDGTLYLRRRGLPFWQDDAKCAGSDLGNYRLFLQYCNKHGEYICGDVGMAFRHDSKGRQIEQPEARWLHTDFQIERENGTFAYSVPGCARDSFDYTQADVLKLVNSDSAVQYKRIVIVD